MSEITSKAFGYLVAYIIPGAFALFIAGMWSPWIQRFINTVLGSETSTALFLSASVVAIGFGLAVSLVRSAVFEETFRRALHPQRLRQPLSADDTTGPSFARLSVTGRLGAAQSVVDEAYRYHQLWGGAAVLFPLFVASWMHLHAAGRPMAHGVVLGLGALAFEYLLIVAARESLVRYRTWMQQILDRG